MDILKCKDVDIVAKWLNISAFLVGGGNLTYTCYGKCGICHAGGGLSV